MKIFCDFGNNQRGHDIGDKIVKLGIAQRNIQTDFANQVQVRFAVIPKTKESIVLEAFHNEIKEGCPAKWLEQLGITHYWQEEGFPENLVEKESIKTENPIPIGSHWLDKMVTWTKI